MPGRRDFMTYRDLGVTAASDGRIRARLPPAKQGLTRPTGWHTHICEGQIVYMLSGWIDLAFEHETIRIEEGDSLYIPGGTPHNEVATSDTFDLNEVSVPADMGHRALRSAAGMARRRLGNLPPPDFLSRPRPSRRGRLTQRSA